MRVESILSNSVSKVKWAVSHFLFTFVDVAGIIAILAIAAGITASYSMNDINEFIKIFYHV